jgi:hypothetical protein
MSACTQSTTCPIVKLFMGKPSLRIWTDRYCDGGFQACARFSLERRGQAVPAWLLPNGRSIDVGARA